MRGQQAAPGIKDLDRLRPCRYLHIEIAPIHLGHLLHQSVIKRKIRVHHLLEAGKILATLPFNHITGQGKGGPAKTDQRNATVQSGP